MNQFKRAKQLRTESGQSVESITDLKTAGVAVKPESDKKDNIHNVIHEEVHEDSSESEHTPTNDINSNSNTSDSIIIEATEPVQKNTDTEENTIKEIKTNAKEPISTEQHDTLINPAKNKQLPDAHIAVIPAVSSQIPEESLTTPVNNAVETAPVPVANEVVNVPTPTVIVPEPMDAAPQQFQPQYQQYVEPVVTKPSKSTRKSAPNIFAPKGEAKSMRKSLVLKPTSVKIAENYCAKNGGSFNELIQTLLDNFIDEYGL